MNAIQSIATATTLQAADDLADGQANVLDDLEAAKKELARTETQVEDARDVVAEKKREAAANLTRKREAQRRDDERELADLRHADSGFEGRPQVVPREERADHFRWVGPASDDVIGRAFAVAAEHHLAFWEFHLAADVHDIFRGHLADKPRGIGIPVEQFGLTVAPQ